ncbi:hypothetical protein RRG08_048469 [Elysia crispata]|uniref:Uncharacterized protein n=1 Tax=Elysia crispata TaxID=231223 RepID=A0AAE1EBV1_9GAST|nr:hypothetical protein RRG08_048469 [Elysia crispata]
MASKLWSRGAACRTSLSCILAWPVSPHHGRSKQKPEVSVIVGPRNNKPCRARTTLHASDSLPSPLFVFAAAHSQYLPPNCQGRRACILLVWSASFLLFKDVIYRIQHYFRGLPVASSSLWWLT